MKKTIKLPSSQYCTSCGGCVDICSQKAISCSINQNGYKEIHINQSVCIHCGQCEAICPIMKTDDNINSNPPTPFWAWSKNDLIRLKSSSGGLFAQIATSFINEYKGVVVGATLLNGKEVKHIAIDNVANITLLQGSKYLQSDTENIYRIVVHHLKNGIKVLFSGTPCQVAAIKSITENKAYQNNLYTIEVICHGIPSYTLFQLGLKLNNADSVDTFRSKEDGWNGCKMVYSTKDKKTNYSSSYASFFYDAFFNDLYLKPSCYNCKFARIPRIADLSIADGWGVECTDISKDEQKKGISLALSNNHKGDTLLNNDDLTKYPASWSDFVFKNPCSISNLSHLEKISLSNNINKIRAFLPLKLSIYILSCKSPKKGWGIIAKPFIKYILYRKEKLNIENRKKLIAYLELIDKQ